MSKDVLSNQYAIRIVSTGNCSWANVSIINHNDMNLFSEQVYFVRNWSLCNLVQEICWFTTYLNSLSNFRKVKWLGHIHPHLLSETLPKSCQVYASFQLIMYWNLIIKCKTQKHCHISPDMILSAIYRFFDLKQEQYKKPCRLIFF